MDQSSNEMECSSISTTSSQLNSSKSETITTTTTTSQPKSRLPFDLSNTKSVQSYEDLFDSGYNSNVQSKTYLDSETDISTSSASNVIVAAPAAIASPKKLPQAGEADYRRLRDKKLDSTVLLDSGVSISDSSIEISETCVVPKRENSIELASTTTAAASATTTTSTSKSAAEVAANLLELCQKQNEEGDTLLHLAIIENLEDVACSIIMNPMLATEVLDSYNYLYQTPLHLAVLTQQRKVIECLVSRGASVTFQDSFGNTPLHIACKYSLTDIVQYFLVSSYRSLVACNMFDIRNSDGDTCTHLAAHNNNFQILELLFQTGAFVNSQEGKSGKTILHLAVENLNVPQVHFLIKKCKADAFAKNFADVTPIYLAYKIQSLLGNDDYANRAKMGKIIKILLENNEQAFNSTSNTFSSSDDEYSDEEN